MSVGKTLASGLGAAVLISATVVFFLAPRLERYQTDLAAMQPEPAPAPTEKRTSVNFADAAIINREEDGHYWTRAEVQGTAVKFMVDTGASTVALTYRDAQRIGLEPETLDYRWEIRTAGGITHGAAVTLDSIRIGQVEVEQVNAMILKDGLEQSLLGMTFLGELYSYEFKQSQLIIRR
ncbi:MAG: TIGR02281 family clan AA aspartic protease [Hyphomonas sp.]|nr:TIGR02281 family clan AA aspartic protease [Hyphomonas sp.]